MTMNKPSAPSLAADTAGNSAPIFSIIMPTFNRAGFISKAIESVLSQTEASWELIVVDDGSTDATAEVVGMYCDPRVQYHWKINEERSAARNFGIGKARGEYICFLDSDDWYASNHLECLAHKIRNVEEKEGLFYTKVERVGGGSGTAPSYKPEDHGHPLLFVLYNFLLIDSVCVHKKILQQFRFPNRFNVWEDTHLWLRIVANYPFYQIDHVTSYWNIHEAGSVRRNFSAVTNKILRCYLECIDDLRINHLDCLHGLLSERDFMDYKISKALLMLTTAARKRQYLAFVQGWFAALPFINSYGALKILYGAAREMLLSDHPS